MAPKARAKGKAKSRGQLQTRKGTDSMAKSRNQGLKTLCLFDVIRDQCHKHGLTETETDCDVFLSLEERRNLDFEVNEKVVLVPLFLETTKHGKTQVETAHSNMVLKTEGVHGPYVHDGTVLLIFVNHGTLKINVGEGEGQVSSGDDVWVSPESYYRIENVGEGEAMLTMQLIRRDGLIS